MLLQHGKKENACVGSCAELGSLLGLLAWQGVESQ